MFWDSIVGGLKVLTFWQTYAAALEYLVIYMVPMALLGYFASKSRFEMAIGCVGMVALAILQCAAMLVFILTLAPIILGISDQAAWGLPVVLLLTAPGAFLKMSLLLLGAAIVVAFVPLIGRMQAFNTMIVGVIGLMLVLAILESMLPGSVSKKNISLWPGFWFMAGLLVIGAICAWIGTLVVAILVFSFNEASRGIAQLVMVPVAGVFGFLPLFMYGAWLGAQLRPT